MKNAYLKYLLALLLFGSNGIVASHISLNSYEIVLLRSFIGSLFLLAVFMMSKGIFRIDGNKRDFRCLIISGVSVATLAYYCGPVLVMIFSPIVFHEKITGVKLLGFLSVLTGMFLVNRQELSQNGPSWGLLCGILSAVMYAFMVIFNKKATGITGLKNSMYQLSLSFLVVGLFTVIKQRVAIDIAPQNILPILILGVVNTGVGCYLYFSSIPRLPAQSVAICGYLEPVSALIFSMIFLNERLTPVQLAGTVLILGGAAFGEFYKRSKSDPPLCRNE